MSEFSKTLHSELKKQKQLVMDKGAIKASDIRNISKSSALNSNDGTLLEVYFAEEAKFIRAFLRKMIKHDMPGSEKFILNESDGHKKLIRAYEIGQRGTREKKWVFGSGVPGQEYTDLRWDRAVYLCEDGTLREKSTIRLNESLHNLIVGDEFLVGEFIYFDLVRYDEKKGLYKASVRCDFVEIEIKALLVKIAAINILSLKMSC